VWSAGFPGRRRRTYPPQPRRPRRQVPGRPIPAEGKGSIVAVESGAYRCYLSFSTAQRVPPVVIEPIELPTTPAWRTQASSIPNRLQTAYSTDRRGSGKWISGRPPRPMSPTETSGPHASYLAAAASVVASQRLFVPCHDTNPWRRRSKAQTSRQKGTATRHHPAALRDVPANPHAAAANSASAAAACRMTGAQSPIRAWRKMRSVGYHGLSVRPLSQRQQLS